MDAYEAIVSKRDTREYEARAIEAEALRRIVQAGRMAGSSKNAQPIRLVVLTEEAEKRAIAGCGDFTEHLPGSPLVIVIVRLGESRAFDAGRVGQNMMIAAQALGIASCPVGIQHDDCARERLGLPADAVVAMAITFGYPRGGGVVGRGERRIEVDEFVRRGRWDGPRGLDRPASR
jgi:nitroreductase